MLRLTVLLTLVALSPALAADDIVTTAAANGSFRTLVNLLAAAELDDDLRSKGPFTVFAPSDEAFAKIPPETLAALLKPEGREQLAEILKYHVLPRSVSVPKNNRGHRLTESKTLAGAEVRFTRNGQDVRVNDAKIVARNIKASNGYIHVIDSVLMPPKDESIVAVAQEAGQFKTLLTALEAAKLAETLRGKGPFTVFAPTDKAFAKLPKGTLQSLLKKENRETLANILKLHVVSGKVSARDAIRAGKAKTLAGQTLSISIREGRLTINESGVSANDVEASNGIIHVIDTVLLPESKAKENTKTEGEKRVSITATWEDNIVRDGVEADVVEVTVNPAGSVTLTNLKAGRLITRVKGGAAFTVSGSTAQHEAIVYGGGRLNAADLETAGSSVKAYGGAFARMNARDSLEISANAGAIVEYKASGARVTANANKYAKVVDLNH